ncbi:MAG: PKD domain-containing protein, partial [Anaerolineae bacterium]
MERWRKLTRNQQIGIMAAALVLIIVGALLIFGGDDDLQGTAGGSDRDGDTVADESDRCPDDAGDPNLAGCPDGDSDGVPDIDDACPADPNDAVGDPCNHDEDGDGVLDVDDACPNLANDGIGDPCNPDDNVVPTDVPTEVPTEIVPTEVPTEVVVPTEAPTEEAVPTEVPTEVATEVATEVPTEVPTEPAPTEVAALPTEAPTEEGGQAGATINVGFEASIGVDGAVTFTNTSSGDTFAGFSWNFGDGSAASTETSPTHTYLNAGTYAVTLTATTSDGRTLTATSDVVLTEEQLPPVSCAFNIVVVGQSGPPYTLPLEVQFVNNSQNVASYVWTFEDNSTSTDANPVNRTYSVAGSYPIKLDCISPRGNLVANGSVNATQSGGGSQTFRAGFTASPGSGEAPLTVQFTDTSVGAVSWAWDFGDGNTSTDQNPTHQYTTVGVFNVTLTVSNGTLTAVATGSIETVTALARPIADFSVTPQEGNAP